MKLIEDPIELDAMEYFHHKGFNPILPMHPSALFKAFYIPVGLLYSVQQMTFLRDPLC